MTTFLAWLTWHERLQFAQGYAILSAPIWVYLLVRWGIRQVYFGRQRVRGFNVVARSEGERRPEIVGSSTAAPVLAGPVEPEDFPHLAERVVGSAHAASVGSGGVTGSRAG